ncbi:MAG: poly-beta-hydroxybutyrate polymerase [Comamonadaceae bacterium CG_4_9_14_0_8_um_filter_57_21]|nr:MAG: poly-beta-hydroxybutyrate polymerase [Comamonadaceae bacterium CG_4_9_14_0_8_um_filter_57_21]
MNNSLSAALPQATDTLDRWAHVQLSPLTRGVSTAALRMAFGDWLTHLSHNPGQQLKLVQEALKSIQQLTSYVPSAVQVSCKPCIEPAIQDRRFSHPSWQIWPFNVISQSFLLTQQWWQDATAGLRGVSQHHEDVVSFTVRQMLDMVSPANFVWSNPEVLARMYKTGGTNLWQGFQNFIDDVQRLQKQLPALGTEAYQVGKNVAITPGKVILRNRLIELIQYAPAHPKVWPEPILIVPSWIMKYYILDLSPANTLIGYLVEQGHTVFSISWKNPVSEDRDLGMDDYLRLGVMDAINAVGAVVPKQKIHAVGYCLGGTLLTIAAAAMGREGDDRLATMSLLAAQTDFTEPGELALFIDDSQISYLEDIMWDKGYLDSTQMAATFQLLNSNDLVWSRMLRQYLLGERTTVTDLMAWNADGTRLPYRMHTEYLRRLFLNNDLASGRYLVNDKPIALTDIMCQIYCIGTINDHVAPWRSVYKLTLLTDVDITFLLTSGGHNAGIVNPPGVPGRSYQVLTRHHDDKYLAPDEWLRKAPQYEGSWWPDWAEWIQSRSGKPMATPSVGNVAKGLTPICDAPGIYVLQK